MAEITSMKNIGKEMSKKLAAIGVESPEMLIEMGAKQAYLKIKALYPEVCLVHLYTLQAAIEGIEFNCLSEPMKQDLKEFSDSFK